MCKDGNGKTAPSHLALCALVHACQRAVVRSQAVAGQHLAARDAGGPQGKGGQAEQGRRQCCLATPDAGSVGDAPSCRTTVAADFARDGVRARGDGLVAGEEHWGSVGRARGRVGVR